MDGRRGRINSANGSDERARGGGRAERNKTSWEEKDDVIGQEKIEDDKVEEKFGDDKKWVEEETGIGQEKIEDDKVEE